MRLIVVHPVLDCDWVDGEKSALVQSATGASEHLVLSRGGSIKIVVLAARFPI